MTDHMTEAMVTALRSSGVFMALEILETPDSHDAYPADTAFWVLLRSVDRQARALGIQMDYQRAVATYRADGAALLNRPRRSLRCPHGRSVASRLDNPCSPGLAACRL